MGESPVPRSSAQVVGIPVFQYPEEGDLDLDGECWADVIIIHIKGDSWEVCEDRPLTAHNFH